MLSLTIGSDKWWAATCQRSGPETAAGPGADRNALQWAPGGTVISTKLKMRWHGRPKHLRLILPLARIGLASRKDRPKSTSTIANGDRLHEAGIAIETLAHMWTDRQHHPLWRAHYEQKPRWSPRLIELNGAHPLQLG
jgi:hypothetical protein